ncbi:outer membrane lipid asymmetry maintenance protein MlaD [Geoalkalibacter sp.]|uniref:outer membrane lipid asymmetry maintenance protein MlaD n=1 Tax=Geoalkalibacter sp. TaxID=3041440 RepID=UPI00272ECC1A|nr:outer membrane lipid asymmetry maintenance protein MlaD [Geoalkalibacter sp.]
MKRFNVEVSVGLFLVLGFLCFAWLAVKLGDVRLFGDTSYRVTARFGSISGLKPGAQVEIAGVKVGRVARISLDPERYDAVVELAMDRDVRLTEDSIASIRTAGIIGDRYVSISPGGAMDYIEPGGRIHETESAINLEELISKYIFESK